MSLEQEIPRYDPEIQSCAYALADAFRNGHALLLDVDGVICKSTSLSTLQLTTPDIIPAIKSIRNPVGVATARSSHIIDSLDASYDLQLSGVSILESGHVLMIQGEKKYLSHPNHRTFISDVRNTLKNEPGYQQHWDQVKKHFQNSGVQTFCPGDIQWQGECRASFWHFATYNEEYDRYVYESIFKPLLFEVARKNNMDFENDIAITLDPQEENNLGIISIKGKVNGRTVTKGFAAEQLMNKWIFVADGYEDQEMADYTKKIGGMVIGIKGNQDKSSQAETFLNQADYKLNSPEEFTQVLRAAAMLI